MSTTEPGRCTYLTTLPLMKTFFTDDYPRIESAWVQSSKTYRPYRVFARGISRCPRPAPTAIPTTHWMRERKVHAHKMRVFDLLHDADIVQLDIKILIHRLQRAPDLDVVLELNGYLMVDEGFEETICMLASGPIHAALTHNAK